MDCEVNGGGTVTLAFGVHVVDYNITIPSFITLQGEGRDSTRVDFVDANFNISVAGTASARVRNLRIRDLTIERSANVNAALDITYADFLILDNVRFSDNAGSGAKIRACQQYTVINCLADNNLKHGFELAGNTGFAHARGSWLGCISTNNTLDGFNVQSSASAITANLGFVACEADANGGDGFDFDPTPTSLEMDIFVSDCIANGNTENGFECSASYVSFTGCTAQNNVDGFEIAGIQCAVVACVATDNSGLDYQFTTRVQFVANSFEFGTSVDPATLIDHADIAIQSVANVGGNTRTEKDVAQMNNTSGGTLAQGATVIMKGAADGDEVTTTTTQGDDRIFGMCMFSHGNNAYGAVLRKGYTTLLKVDGTTDIAIGDFLGAYTVAGIAGKVSSGMAFAIALEAYTGNDSNGVINAYLFEPRGVGAAASLGGTATLGQNSDVDTGGTYQEAGDGDDEVTMVTTRPCKFFVIATRNLQGNSDTGRTFLLKIQQDTVDIAGTEVLGHIGAMTGSSDHKMPITSQGLTATQAAGTYVFRVMQNSDSGRTVTFSGGSLTVIALPQ